MRCGRCRSLGCGCHLETLSLLRRLGFRRIGQVMDEPRAPFAARFEELLLRLDQALGRAPEPFTPIVAPPAYRVQAAFLEPITASAHVLEAATRLLEELAMQLAHDAVGARVLRLLLFRVDGEVQSLDLGLAAPSRDAAHIARLIALQLERLADDLDADFGFEAAAVHVLTAEPLAERQRDLTMDEASAPPDALPQLVDRLRQRLGQRAVYALQPYQSHLPERAVRKASPSPRALATSPPIPRARGEGRGEGQKLAPTVAYTAAPHPNPLPMPEEAWGEGMISAPRPLLLLPRPEPADVVALIPEGPPRQFRWRGVLHQVVEAQGPERIAPEWWRRTGEDERDYYMVEDTAGRRFWLYRAGIYGRSETTPAVVHARGVWMTAFAELVAATNFSFLRGASHAQEMVRQAAELGLAAIGIADRNTLAGVVRAHTAAKEHSIRLLVGARLITTDGFEAVCYPTDRAAYGRLCRLLTLGNRRAPKGQCHFSFAEMLEAREGQIFIAMPPRELVPAFRRAADRACCMPRPAASISPPASPTAAMSAGDWGNWQSWPRRPARRSSPPTMRIITTPAASRSPTCWSASARSAPSRMPATAWRPMPSGI